MTTELLDMNDEIKSFDLESDEELENFKKCILIYKPNESFGILSPLYKKEIIIDAKVYSSVAHYVFLSLPLHRSQISLINKQKNENHREIIAFSKYEENKNNLFKKYLTYAYRSLFSNKIYESILLSTDDNIIIDENEYIQLVNEIITRIRKELKIEKNKEEFELERNRKIKKIKKLFVVNEVLNKLTENIQLSECNDKSLDELYVILSEKFGKDVNEVISQSPTDEILLELYENQRMPWLVEHNIYITILERNLPKYNESKIAFQRESLLRSYIEYVIRMKYNYLIPTKNKEPQKKSKREIQKNIDKKKSYLIELENIYNDKISKYADNISNITEKIEKQMEMEEKSWELEKLREKIAKITEKNEKLQKKLCNQDDTLLERIIDKEIRKLANKKDLTDRLIELKKRDLLNHEILEIYQKRLNEQGSCSNPIKRDVSYDKLCDDNVFGKYMYDNSIFSPKYISNLTIEDKNFPSVLHYAYYKMFCHYGKLYNYEDNYYEKIKNLENIEIEFSYFERFLRKQRMINSFEEAMNVRINNTFKKELILTGEKRLIYNSKLDDILGVGSNNTGDNYVGNYLENLRENLLKNQQK